MGLPMPGRIKSKLTYANVMATIAVFIALGGASYAAFHLPKNSVKSKNIVNGQVKQADVSHTVTVAGAQTATNAQHATSADTATDSTKLGGTNASAFALNGAEDWNAPVLNDGSVGGSQQPGTSCHWTNYGGEQNPAGYFRDRAGVVHLRGFVLAKNGTSNNCSALPDDLIVTILPAGYRPESREGIATISNNLPGRINVLPTGEVEIEEDFPLWANALTWVSLDGISFRCAPSGQDGCP
jgi:hypothetical protein